MLVAVGFLLEPDVEICLGPVPVLQIKQTPLNAIPDEERQVEQLTLLSRVNQLVVEFNGIEVSQSEDETKEVNGQIVFAKRMFPDFSYYLHDIACFVEQMQVLSYRYFQIPLQS